MFPIFFFHTELLVCHELKPCYMYILSNQNITTLHVCTDEYQRAGHIFRALCGQVCPGPQAQGVWLCGGAEGRRQLAVPEDKDGRRPQQAAHGGEPGVRLYDRQVWKTMFIVVVIMYRMCNASFQPHYTRCHSTDHYTISYPLKTAKVGRSDDAKVDSFLMRDQKLFMAKVIKGWNL